MKPTQRTFPIPDLRTAAFVHATGSHQAITVEPEARRFLVTSAKVTRLGPVPPEGHRLTLRRDGQHQERTDALQRRAPAVVITSRWTWEAGMGQPTEDERKICHIAR